MYNIEVRQSREASSRALETGRDDHAAVEEHMKCTLFELLMSYYPGHFWMVDVCAVKQMASIRIPHFMGNTLGFNIPITSIDSYPAAQKWAKLAGGEILERWRIPRSGVDFGAFLNARQNHRIVNVNDPIPG